MKELLFVFLFLVSCQNEPKPTKLSHVKEIAKNTFSKGVGEGIAYKVFSTDSSFVYIERFSKVVIDSSDNYTERYANAFLNLTNKKILPTEIAIKKEIGSYSPLQSSESNSIIQKEQIDAFDLVNSKSEHIGEHINTMELYVSKSSFDIDALKRLCSKRKSEFTNGFFSYILDVPVFLQQYSFD
jgi:hypothetical protein